MGLRGRDNAEGIEAVPEDHLTGKVEAAELKCMEVNRLFECHSGL